jgi:hypothetical protein
MSETSSPLSDRLPQRDHTTAMSRIILTIRHTDIKTTMSYGDPKIDKRYSHNDVFE